MPKSSKVSIFYRKNSLVKYIRDQIFCKEGPFFFYDKTHCAPAAVCKRSAFCLCGFTFRITLERYMCMVLEVKTNIYFRRKKFYPNNILVGGIRTTPGVRKSYPLYSIKKWVGKLLECLRCPFFLSSLECRDFETIVHFEQKRKKAPMQYFFYIIVSPMTQRITR